ncbi:CPBP family intramembrane glutamic endopeptidase [Bacillus solimangrovi]|uniref:CAAX prenyl protease 2/Lysostaphin resistance protein A-like domain-containing protein n=1 Tax=Bacillus solimangrovi TaxID=1305675 RepID=A0A1E5LJL1_9BACI|nr:CPBP family intramembrane glutamic endopeptidase [Bacillus solimangrovi]OEH94283.1 hypothetical protein BFG57_08475 [Bacillus solimangrovi]
MPNKQKIGIFFWLIIFIVTLSLRQFEILKLVTLLGLPLLIMGFGPMFYQKISLNRKFWFIPIVVSINLGIFFIDINPIPFNSSVITIVLLTLFIPIILLIFRLKECYQTIKTTQLFEPLNNTDFLRMLCQSILLLIGEEILFRGVFFQTLYNEKYAVELIVLNILIFVYYHYFNRFSASIYKTKDYIFHGLLAINLSVLYIYTQSLFLCIISHFIYNSISILSLLLRSSIYQNFKKKGDASLQ